MPRRKNFAFEDATSYDREKFFSFLASGQGDACWGWTGLLTKAGYPIFRGTLVRRLLPAAFPALFTDEDRHARRWTTSCEQTGCTNPSHLRAGKPYTKKPKKTEAFICARCGETKQRRKGSTRPFCSARCRTAEGQEIREAKMRNLLERLDDVKRGVEALTIRKAPRGMRT